MKRIFQANIDRFKQLLETEADPTKRKTLLRLLSEEQAKMDAFQASPSADKKTS